MGRDLVVPLVLQCDVTEGAERDGHSKRLKDLKDGKADRKSVV